MRVEIRQFKHRTNLLVFPESEEESKIVDEMGPLDCKLVASPRLADGYAEYYVLVEGQDREEQDASH